MKTFFIAGIIIVSLGSAFRGYYQGLQQMQPTAAIQVLEQMVRVVTGLALANLLLSKGIEFAAVGASVGIITGEMSGFAAIIAFYFLQHPSTHRSPSLSPNGPLSCTLGRIFTLAVPVTLTRIIASAGYSVMAMLNLCDIRRITHLKLNWRHSLIKPLFAATCKGPIILLSKQYIIYHTGYRIL